MARKKVKHADFEPYSHRSGEVVVVFGHSAKIWNKIVVMHGS